MRPIYETKKDRAREYRVLDAIAKRYKCSYHVLPHLSNADSVLLDSKRNPAAIVEVKTRSNKHNTYPTYMLSEYKWQQIRKLAKKHLLPAFLFVSFTDGIYVTKLRKKYEVAVGGRRDRGDRMDMEKCIYIPIGQFRKM